MSKIKIGVLVSGGGTNLQALINAQERGELGGGIIKCVISSRPDAYALKRAKDHGIPTRVIQRKSFPDVEAYSNALIEALYQEYADLVVQAGFMTILSAVCIFGKKLIRRISCWRTGFCIFNTGCRMKSCTRCRLPRETVWRRPCTVWKRTRRSAACLFP